MCLAAPVARARLERQRRSLVTSWSHDSGSARNAVTEIATGETDLLFNVEILGFRDISIWIDSASQARRRHRRFPCAYPGKTRGQLVRASPLILMVEPDGIEPSTSTMPL